MGARQSSAKANQKRQRYVQTEVLHRTKQNPCRMPGRSPRGAQGESFEVAWERELTHKLGPLGGAPSHVMSCHVTSCRGVLCRVMSSYVVLLDVTLVRFLSSCHWQHSQKVAYLVFEKSRWLLSLA